MQEAHQTVASIRSRDMEEVEKPYAMRKAMLRANSLVILDTSRMTDKESMEYPTLLWEGDPLVFLGEIPNKPGYGIFMGDHHNYIGWKISLFKEVPMQEVLGIQVV